MLGGEGGDHARQTNLAEHVAGGILKLKADLSRAVLRQAAPGPIAIDGEANRDDPVIDQIFLRREGNRRRSCGSEWRSVFCAPNRIR